MTESVFINGTVGTGKSTTASTLGKLLESRNVPHAVIDLDHIRRAWPAPSGDPFHLELELSNLASLAANYQRAGVERFILAGVIEHASELPRYLHALGSDRLFVVWLRTQPDILAARLRVRHASDPAALDWHLKRADELDAILSNAGVHDLELDSSRHTPAELAEHLAGPIHW